VVSGARLRHLTSRRTVVLLVLLGALLVLLAGTRTWATVTLSGTLPGLSDLPVPGRRSAPGAIAVALAAAAAAVVLATSGRIVRVVVAAGLVIAGAVVVAGGLRGARDSDHAVVIALRDSLRVAGGSASSGASRVSISIWPWVAVAGGGVILLAGLLALLGGRTWSGPSRRYERAPAGSAAVTGAARAGDARGATGPAARPAATWDALSRGEDPTSAPEEPT
jgi:uncharacterized membrane protein (TIGR02234 family)